MTILVTGSTGTIGSQLVAELAAQGADVHAFTRDHAKASFPAGVTAVKGDLLDVTSLRAALAPASTLFLLNAATPDEVTQALLTLNLAREAGIERIVYFSVLHSDRFVDVPHFAGKFAVEHMIERLDLPATVLRPTYFINNDRVMKDALLGPGVYAQPVGGIGLAMIDTRDIVAVAAAELLRRERADAPLPREVIDLVGPEALTGEAIAEIWAEVLGQPVRYGGDDAASVEERFKAFAPGWLAYDLRRMFERFQSDGMLAEVGDVERLERRLGRPLRTYRAFAEEMASAWTAPAAKAAE